MHMRTMTQFKSGSFQDVDSYSFMKNIQRGVDANIQKYSYFTNFST